MIKRAWSVLLVLFLINLLNFLDRQLPGALAEPIRREFALSDTALGLLSTVFTLMYAAAGLPLGFVADRWHRPRLIAAGVSIWSLFTLAGALASSYSMLFAARIGVGIGEASCSPAAQSLIGDLFPQRQRARAMAVFMVGLPLGILLSYVIGGQIGSRYGWRAPLIVAGVPGLLMAGLILFAQDPVRGAADPHLVGGPQRGQLGTLLRTPTLWWIVASGALHNFNMYAVSAFLTPFLQRFHGLGLKEANNVSAFALGALGVIGMLAGGWIADHLGTRRAEGRILLAAIAMVAGAPLMYLALELPSGALLPFMGLMGASLMLLYVYYATVYAALQDIVDPRSRGLAVALYFFAMYVLGASAGPVTTGWLSDHFAREAMVRAGSLQMQESFKAAGLHSAMFIIPIIAGVCALVLYAGSRTVARDVQRLRSRSADSGAAALSVASNRLRVIRSSDNTQEARGEPMPASPADPTEPVPPHLQLIQMGTAAWIAMIVHGAAKIDLADHLGSGAKTAEQLSGPTGTHTHTLHRFMRTLAGLGILTEGPARHFALTPLGEALKRDAPGAARATLLTFGGKHFWNVMREFPYCLQTGETGQQKAAGMPLFQYFAQHPDEASLFSETMVGFHGAEPPAIAAAYDFSGIGTLVDVGGATGNLLTTILASFTQLRGMLFDLPHVERDAQALIAARGMTDRISISPGSFFERIPEGGDAYLMSHVIHDWNEDQCLTILGNCRKAMPPHGRLLIVESVLPPGDTMHQGKLLDMVMLLAPGGEERDEEEYRTLLAKAGFRLSRVVPTSSAVSVIEAVPA